MLFALAASREENQDAEEERRTSIATLPLAICCLYLFALAASREEDQDAEEEGCVSTAKAAAATAATAAAAEAAAATRAPAKLWAAHSVPEQRERLD